MLTLRRTGWGVGVPPFKWFKIKWIGGLEMKSDRADKGPPSHTHTHTREVDFFGLPDHVGALNCNMILILSNLTWDTARQSTAPEVPKKAAKYAKNTLEMA